MTKWQIAQLLFAPSSVPQLITLSNGVQLLGIVQGITRESGDGRNFIVYTLVGSEVHSCYVKTID